MANLILLFGNSLLFLIICIYLCYWTIKDKDKLLGVLSYECFILFLFTLLKGLGI